MISVKTNYVVVSFMDGYCVRELHTLNVMGRPMLRWLGDYADRNGYHFWDERLHIYRYAKFDEIGDARRLCNALQQDGTDIITEHDEGEK